MLNKRNILVFVTIFTILCLRAENIFGQIKGLSTHVGHNTYTYISNRNLSFSAESGITILAADNVAYKPANNAQIGIGYQLSNIIVFKATIGYGSLDGDFSNNGKILIVSDYLEANMIVKINLHNLIFGLYSYNKYNVFPHFGLGQMHIRSAMYNTGTNNITYTGYENQIGAGNGLFGRLVVLKYSLGVEFNMKITNNMDLFIDITTNVADSDRIDGVPINGSSADWYHTCNFGINYYLKHNLSKNSSKGESVFHKQNKGIRGW